MPLVSPKAAAAIVANPDTLRRVASAVARIYETNVCPVILNTTAHCKVQIFADGATYANGRRPQQLYNASVDLTDPNLSHWPTDWIIGLQPAEGWLRYDLPWIFIWEYLRGRDDSPCLPWNRLNRGKVSESRDARCAGWWYSTESGERARLAASTALDDIIAQWLARLTAPWVEGYNDEEPCSVALGRFYQEYAPLACAYSYDSP